MACLAMMLIAPATALARPANGGASAPVDEVDPPTSVLGGTAPAIAGAQGAIDQETLTPPAGVIVKQTALVRGKLNRATAGRRVVLELFDAKRGWSAVATGTAGTDGSFLVRWRPRHIGRMLLRASAGAGATASGHAPGPVAPIEVYRPVVATFFGPGNYGSTTACGQILTPALLGVAHRTLPCGTVIDIVYANHTISVPVVDRGPYANGATYDLTSAAATALGVRDTVAIGALAIRRARPAPG